MDAVEYLHQHKVIHRDIKLGNILLTKDMRLKISDFGLSAKLSSYDERRRTVCGTPNYMAPELLINNAEGHSFEVDIWAIGVVIYTLVFGRPPFETEEVQTTYQRIKLGLYTFPADKDFGSDELRDLLKQIFTVDPDKRLSISQIRKHPWFFKDGVVLGPMPASSLAIRMTQK